MRKIGSGRDRKNKSVVISRIKDCLKDDEFANSDDIQKYLKDSGKE